MAMAEDLLGRSIMATMMCDQVISPKFETLALGVAINHSRVRCSSTPQFSFTAFDCSFFFLGDSDWTHLKKKFKNSPSRTSWNLIVED